MAAPHTTDVNVDWRLLTIGRGSFASVSVLTGRPVAFKHVIVPAKEKKQELLKEFDTLRRIYDSCNGNSFFAIPRPFAFYDPDNPESFRTVNGFPRFDRRRGTVPPFITQNNFKLMHLETAAYAMDHVQPLPLEFAYLVRSLFYPEHAGDAPNPSLCRIYFGKVISEVGRGGRPNRFFNSANFPLDVARYRRILENSCAGEYPSVEDITFGMGEMLGRLHWCAGYDGRDIEFVLGGIAFSAISFYVIDFNQVRSWKKTSEDVPTLVEAFFTNDPYYPRPIRGDPLYAQFKGGYLSAYPTTSPLAIQLANDFLCAIEAEQAKRASR
ncbi:hypothetical protein EDD16DRAFT_1650482 [Pisolithus croceorrhizus]|nr:hypothetical protein EDD16DRAFT_1650482 [Pisolithus croceorrhizus]KAI6114702.1 hypothetical protein EV401DRAFT_1979978 [Pisolithus croceorrhizus]KAI6159208.1 hypothetical protein EDD17DRAFT_1614684 [Pisolithus thermaeus]